MCSFTCVVIFFLFCLSFLNRFQEVRCEGVVICCGVDRDELGELFDGFLRDVFFKGGVFAEDPEGFQRLSVPNGGVFEAGDCPGISVWRFEGGICGFDFDEVLYKVLKGMPYECAGLYWT